MPTNSHESAQLAGMLALSESLVAAADKRTGDVQAPLDQAAELAQHTGEGNAYWMGFGPVNVGLWRVARHAATRTAELSTSLAQCTAAHAVSLRWFAPNAMTSSS